MNENTSIMGCIIPHYLPICYMYKMLQLQEHNYLVVSNNILSVRHLCEGGHFENGPYNIVHPK